MPHAALIAGGHVPLVSALAARYLADTDDTVIVAALPGVGPSADEYRTLVLDAVARIGREPEEEGRAAPGRTGPHHTGPHRAGRLRAVTVSGAGGHLGQADTIWYLAAGYACADPRLALRTDSEAARALLRASPALGARDFRYVGPSRLDDRAAAVVTADVVPAYRRLERELSRGCHAAGLEHAIIGCCPVIGAPHDAGELTTGLPHLLDSLCWLRTYVTARYPGYFQDRPVRVLAAPGGTVDVLPASRAASLLLRWRPGEASELSGRCLTLPADPAGSAEALETLAASLRMNLVVTADEAELDLVDRLLADRLGGFGALLTTPAAAPAAAGVAAGANPGGPGTRDAARTALARFADARATPPESSSPPLTEPTEPTEPTAATVRFDSGPDGAATLVIVNALGQGSGYWRHLVAGLSRRYRVILFQPGDSRPDGQPATGDDHLDAIADMLTARQVSDCHLLGWCTGAKTVVRYYLRHPDQVRSLALLTPAFKHPGRPASLDTDYEQRLESTAQLLAARPSLAPRMLRLFSGIFDSDPPSGGGLADLPAAVLATPDPATDAERRRPFATAPGLLCYTRQLLGFWADDVLPDAARVRVPVLLITADHDEVISADGVLAAAARFPLARHERIRGATHYCMHDRPDAVGAVVEELITARSWPDQDR